MPYNAKPASNVGETLQVKCVNPASNVGEMHNGPCKRASKQHGMKPASNVGKARKQTWCLKKRISAKKARAYMRTRDALWARCAVAVRGDAPSGMRLEKFPPRPGFGFNIRLGVMMMGNHSSSNSKGSVQ
jgi:hypothetical protein